MLKGKTSTGFKYQLEDAQLDNYELLESFEELDDNPMILPRVLKMLFGKQQINELKEHVRNKQGIVPAQSMMNEIQEMFEGNATLKK
jgi:hypothetical protein